jgi:hypothetical protein
LPLYTIIGRHNIVTNEVTEMFRVPANPQGYLLHADQFLFTTTALHRNSLLNKLAVKKQNSSGHRSLLHYKNPVAIV